MRPGLPSECDEYELLSTDSEAIPVLQDRRPRERPTVQDRAVSALEIFDDRHVYRQIDANVLARHHRVVDRDVALRAAPDRNPLGVKVELLK